jgi:hypothetical protein
MKDALVEKSIGVFVIQGIDQNGLQENLAVWKGDSCRHNFSRRLNENKIETPS